MGCRSSNQKKKTVLPIGSTNEEIKNTFSLRKYRRINPKYLKLTKGLFHVQEATPSKELSDY